MINYWSEKDIEQLRELYPDRSTREVATLMNRGYQSVKAKASTLKLLKSEGFNKMEHSIHSLTLEEREYIRDNYTEITNHELAKRIGRSESAIQKVRHFYNLSKENSGCFKKGIVPANKGKKMPAGWSTERMKTTQFKKGQIPSNAKTDGHLTIRKTKGRPYIWVRLSNNNWDLLHRVVWRNTMGEIPQGYNVQFKDGNGLNSEPSNLYIINREKQMIQNSIQRYPAELKEIMMLAGKLKRKLKSYEKQDS